MAGRLIRGLVIAALALEGLYLVAINVFLSTSLFDKVVNAKPMDVDIHFARGWSLFPSRVHAKQLSIRGTDSHIEWMLRLDDVDFEVSLLQLMKQEFHVTSVHGSGISFRLRMKVAAPAATEAELRELPTIASLGAVGFLPDEPPNEQERWDDRYWHLWTVRIDHAVAEHVREVWIQNARFKGEADVAGGFYLKPIRAVEVGPLTLAVRDGVVTLDSHVAAEQLAVTAHAAIQKLDPRVTEGAAMLDRVSLAADARLAIPNVGDLGFDLPGSYGLAGRVEVPRAAIRFEKGRLQDGTHVDASSASMAVVGPTLGAAGGVTVAADVAHDQLLAKVSATHIETTLACTADLLTVTLDSEELGLNEPFGDLHAMIDLPGVDLTDAAQLPSELLHDSKVQLRGGSLHGTVHSEVWRKEKRVRGSATLHAKDLDADASTFRVHGEAGVAASVGSFQWDTLEATDTRATLDVPAASLARAAAPRDPLVRVQGMRVDAKAEHLDVAHPARSLHATFAIPNGELFDRDSVRAALGLDGALRLASRHARFSTYGEVAIEGHDARGHLKATFPALAIEDAGRHLAMSATTATVTARLVGDVAKGVVRGDAVVDAEGMGVMTPKAHAVGNVRASAAITRWAVKEKLLAGSAHVDVTNVHGGFDPQALAPDFVASSVALSASATDLDLAHPSMQGVGYAAHVASAELVDARALNVLLPSSEILAIDSGHATVSVDVEASPGEPGARGHADVRLSHAGLILGETHFAGDFALALRASDAKGDGSDIDLEGSVLDMRDVQVEGTSTDTAAWAGTLTLESGQLRLAPTPRLEGELVLRARDANPILGILFRDSLPKLVAGLTHMPHFTAFTHLVVEPQQLVASDLVASGGDLSVRGTYALRGARRSGGAFVVEKGPWSAGVALDPSGAHLRLFGLVDWYKERAARIVGLN